MKTAMWVFAAALCLLGACAATKSPPAPAAVAAPPTVLTWGADTAEKYVYALPPLTRVEPKADILAAVLAAADADPLITAHASADAGAGQAVYSTPVPGWLTAAIKSHKAKFFGFPSSLKYRASRLLVREAALPALGRALTALSSGSTSKAKYAALVGPAGQGASTQLLTLAAMALVEAGGCDVVLHKGPGPAKSTGGWPKPLFLHFKNTTTTAVYESFDAVNAAGLNKPSTVLIYDGNARYEQGVVDLFTGACILTALSPGYDDNAFAMRKSTVTRVHVPPLAPSEFAAIVGAVWPKRTADEVGWAVKRFGLSVRHAEGDVRFTYDMMHDASEAVAEAFESHARAKQTATGASDEELLELCKKRSHNADVGKTKGRGVSALMPAVRDAETDETRCVFASAEARLAVFEAAAWAFAENRAEAEKESRAYALAVLRCAGGVLNVIVAFVIIYRTNKETQKTIAALATLVAPAAPATFAAVV